MTVRDTRSLATLMSHVASDIAYLVQTEIRLAKVEISEKFAAVAAGAAFIGAGAAFLMAALVVVMFAIASWLEYAGLSTQWSLTIVGILGLAIGGVVAFTAINRMKAMQLAPERTIDQMKEDIAVAREHAR